MRITWKCRDENVVFAFYFPHINMLLTFSFPINVKNWNSKSSRAREPNERAQNYGRFKYSSSRKLQNVQLQTLIFYSTFISVTFKLEFRFLIRFFLFSRSPRKARMPYLRPFPINISRTRWTCLQFLRSTTLISLLKS